MDVLNKNELALVLKEIEGHENLVRRYNAFKELDIYNQNQAKYIQQSICAVYGREAAQSMVAETSINFSTSIVNAEASIYKRPAERTFGEASEKEKEQLLALYKAMKSDEKLKTANRFFRLGNQCLLQVVGVKGALKTRVLYKHQYDVVPSEDDNEKAEVIIIPLQARPLEFLEMAARGDAQNQRIADINDTDLTKNRYIIWTDKYNFKCDGNGVILDPQTDTPYGVFDVSLVLNPIETLPFIDISKDKLMGYWAGYGSSLTDFSISFARSLTDLDEIMRIQGYSQPVISSLEEPKSINVGPNRVLWLKKSKGLEADEQPTFEFATPNPDLPGSLKILETKLQMFLTARGADSKAIQNGQAKDYTSGVERLLAMVERSEATVEDKILFQTIEQEYFKLIILWNNYIQTTQDVKDEFNISNLNEKITLTVKFDEPQEVQTKEQKESSAQRRIDMRVLSRKKAVMELYGLDEDQATEYIAEIDAEKETAQSQNKTSESVNG